MTDETRSPTTRTDRARAASDADARRGFDPLVDRDKVPVSDETVPGGVFRDKDGYHDANGNRLTTEEGEKRLRAQQERAMERRSPVEIAAAAREASPPGRSPELAGTDGDPSNLKDPLGQKENAPKVEEKEPSTGAGGENPAGGRQGAGRPRTPGAKPIAGASTMTQGGGSQGGSTSDPSTVSRSPESPAETDADKNRGQ